MYIVYIPRHTYKPLVPGHNFLKLLFNITQNIYFITSKDNQKVIMFVFLQLFNYFLFRYVCQTDLRFQLIALGELSKLESYFVYSI